MAAEYTRELFRINDRKYDDEMNQDIISMESGLRTNASSLLYPPLQKELQVKLEKLSLKLKNVSPLIPNIYSNFMTNKKPLVILILATWRSGSTLLGDILKMIPGSFYVFEPCRHFMGDKALDEKTLDAGLQLINSMINCDYSNLPKYIDHLKINSKENGYFIEKGIIENSILNTLNGDYMKQACEKFPVQIFKTDRMFLSQSLSLLSNNNLNLKVIHLVRDPRGIFNSRRKLSWWCKFESCSSPTYFCRKQEEDLRLQMKLNHQYKSKYYLLKYEDFCASPKMMMKKILEFLGVPYLDVVDTAINDHMVDVKVEGLWNSTYHDPATTPDKWKQELNRTEIDHIQNACHNVMRSLGYSFDYQNKL